MNMTPNVAVRLEERRYAAMRRNDVDTLESLLHPRLIFTHADGRRQDKDAYVDDFRTGMVRFVDVRHDAEATWMVDGLGVVIGWMTGEVCFGDQTRRLDSHTVAVWAKNLGHWKLLAYQATPRPCAPTDHLDVHITHG